MHTYIHTRTYVHAYIHIGICKHVSSALKLVASKIDIDDG